MENITANLGAAIAGSNPEDKHNVIVTTAGKQPEGFGLKSFEGLDGLFTGQLTPVEIKELAKNADVKAIDLDIENSIS